MFPGETRPEIRIVAGDVHLTGVGLDRTYWYRFGDLNDKRVSLRPTDEIGDDERGTNFRDHCADEPYGNFVQ